MSPRALFVTTVDITLEAFLLPFADNFRAQGWQVDALANGATSNEHIGGSFDERFDIAWSRNPLAPANLIGAASRVREIVAAGDYDIVHVHTPIAAWVTRYALRAHGGRPCVIYTGHGFHFYRGQNALKNAVFRTMERVAARWTDYLVTINAEDFEAAQHFPGLGAGRVRYIPGIGVDTERYRPHAIAPELAEQVREELGVSSDAFLVSMIAEFSAVKRHAFALDVVGALSDPRVVVAFVGSGPLEGVVRDEAHRRGIESRVRFAGYRRDIPAVLAASDALLLCSEREGLNRSALEAMASGVPVFGTATRGIADAIGEDEAGWVTPKHDPVAMANALDAAASDPTAVAARGAAARERAVREFALPRIITAYEELYRDALG